MPPQLLTSVRQQRNRRAAQPTAHSTSQAPSLAGCTSCCPLQPPPNSQLCHSMAFNYSYFFRGHVISPDLLKQALQSECSAGVPVSMHSMLAQLHSWSASIRLSRVPPFQCESICRCTTCRTPHAALAAELPHLAGRGRVLGSGSRVADCAIECNNEGIELATAAAPQVRCGMLPDRSRRTGAGGQGQESCCCHVTIHALLHAPASGSPQNTLTLSIAGCRMWAPTPGLC